MLESFVGQNVSLAPATRPGMAYASYIFPAGRLYALELAVPDITLSGPGTVLPHRPEHGFAPAPNRLDACTVSAG